MKTRELLDAGQLSPAIVQLNQEVKQNPSDNRLRTFLFELLCFAGDYERAERQLDVIGHQSETTALGVEVYRGILRAEVTRRRLFSEGLRPSFLFDPPAYIQYHLDALNRLRENNGADAKALLERSESMRPQIKGRLGGQPFSNFRDSDDLLGPVLEIVAKSSYVWLPFEEIRKITIPPPKHLRDLLWVPATIEARDGPAGEVFIPVLYAGTCEEENDQVRLGRMTEWKAIGDGLARGIGQRTFLVEEEERAVLDVREVEFDMAASNR